jgi:hypothetical protein
MHFLQIMLLGPGVDKGKGTIINSQVLAFVHNRPSRGPAARDIGPASGGMPLCQIDKEGSRRHAYLRHGEGE